MNQNANPPSPELGSESVADAVVAIMRFLRVLRYRKSYVMTSVAVACLLGAFYYFTATRIYKATASLLITQTGGEMWNTSTSPQGSRDALTPTYERLFSSAVVLDGAIQRLIAMPPTARIDLAGLSREDWREGLRGSLSANAVRGTSIIELSYRSKSPDAAEAVVDAVVQSYLDFMAKNHKDVSVEVAKRCKILKTRNARRYSLKFV